MSKNRAKWKYPYGQVYVLFALPFYSNRGDIFMLFYSPLMRFATQANSLRNCCLNLTSAQIQRLYFTEGSRGKRYTQKRLNLMW